MATPDRAMHSGDRLIAATQSHIYVLRDVVDNLGNYYVKLHDQHLIEINLESGEAERYWPLRRMKVSHLEASDDRIPGQVTERVGETHDMMALLRDIGAEPMQPHGFLLDGYAVSEGAVTRDGEVILTAFGVRAAARAQLAILRADYPPIETEAAFNSHEVMDFYDLYAPGDWYCEMLRNAVLLRRATGAMRVAKLECETAGGAHVVSFHVFITE
ncbi:MAG: hypothetical protein AB8B82_12330 [Roseovarius sp.]